MMVDLRQENQALRRQVKENTARIADLQTLKQEMPDLVQLLAEARQIDGMFSRPTPMSKASTAPHCSLPRWRGGAVQA